MFCLNNKIHFSLANANNSGRKIVKISSFAHSQTTNKLVNKAANDSARVSGQDPKKNAPSRNQSGCRIWRILPARKHLKPKSSINCEVRIFMADITLQSLIIKEVMKMGFISVGRSFNYLVCRC